MVISVALSVIVGVYVNVIYGRYDVDEYSVPRKLR